jgi:hypothetical protein
MLRVVMLSVIMLSVVMLSVIMLSVVMLSVIMLNVVMLNVVMLSVVAPKNWPAALWQRAEQLTNDSMFKGLNPALLAPGQNGKKVS